MSNRRRANNRGRSRANKTNLDDLDGALSGMILPVANVKTIVDPAEEKLKNEFADIKRSFIPMQSIVRIDEVEKEGACKVTEAPSGSNIRAFPFPSMASSKPVSD